MPAVVAVEIALALFACGWVCRAMANTHTSPWWLGSYGSILGGFVALAFGAASGGL